MKTYETPELQIHGSVQELTQLLVQPGSDDNPFLGFLNNPDHKGGHHSGS